MLDLLEEWKPALEKKGLAIAVITQASPDETKAFCAERAPGICCFSDPDRKVYSAYRLARGGLRETFLSLHVWLANGRAQREKGYRVELPPAGQDAFQMAGIFVIGTDGRIRLPYYYNDIADHPMAELALEGVLSTNWNVPFDAPFGG
jgi:peroxiredoxin